MKNKYSSNRLVLGVIFITLSAMSNVFSVSSHHVMFNNNSSIIAQYDEINSIKNQNKMKFFIIANE